MSPIKLIKRITEWSFSRYKLWKTCELAAKFKFVDKLEETQTKAQEGGVDVHKLACEWASKRTDKGKPSKMLSIPKLLYPFHVEFAELRKSKDEVIVETDCNPGKQEKEFARFAWGFTKDWTLCGFFDKERVWTRQKVDTHVICFKKRIVRIIDYKSGRIYPDDHQQQMELYALCAMLKYEWAKEVLVELWYIDQQEVIGITYTREDIPRLKKLWEDRIKPMLADTQFQARPGKHCGWCSYGVTKGGTCAHG